MNIHLTLAAIAGLLATATATPQIHHDVHRKLQETGKVNIVVTMKAKPTEAVKNLESGNFATRGEKIESLVNRLEALSILSQKEIDSLLVKEADQRLYEAEHRSWISNSRLFNGATIELVEKLAAIPGIESIREQEVADLSISEVQQQTSTETIQWGVDRIQAPKVWAEGNVGQNIVVGVIDTGVRGSHELLKSNIRETHNWYDPDNQVDTPFDRDGHGTHVTGTIVGVKGYGVAPGAKWIGCVGCPERCPEFNLVKCAEFMTCPTDTKGQNRDCSKAPHIINNSWGGSGGRPWYQPYVDAWQAAGIIPVFAQGNSGPNCGTAGSPGDYANVIGVGSMSVNETLAASSSRGPSPFGRMKPDIAAPGRLIVSADNTSDTATLTLSGTSMAAPHVSGAIALLLSAEPNLKFGDVVKRLQSTTDQSNFNATLSTGRGGEDTCGGVFERVFPNNHYGHGRLNIFGAVKGVRQTPAVV